METPCAGNGRPRGRPRGLISWGPAGEGRWPQSLRARPREVTWLHSTWEATEQRLRLRVGGGGGGKAANQGERAEAGRAPDTVPEKRVDHAEASARGLALATHPR